MVVIVSIENDFVTNEVIKNLILLNVDYIRLGESQFVHGLELVVSDSEIDFLLNVGGRVIKYSDISAFWFRKHGIEIMTNMKLKFSDDELFLDLSELKDDIFKAEIKSIREFLFFLLEKKTHIGKFQIGDANKLISFSIARECGLNIPNSLVSTNKHSLEKRIQNRKVILKPVEDAFGYMGSNTWISSINQLGRVEYLALKEELIFPSMVQDYIEKKIELRIFYFKERFFSMAIFSQNDKKTRVDFRNYNDEKPNRMVPFKLPIEIERKLDCFMKKIGLFSGSIDLILTEDNEYVFLEVNPVGQYGMVGRWCNVDLDRLIAESLTIQYK